MTWIFVVLGAVTLVGVVYELIVYRHDKTAKLTGEEEKQLADAAKGCLSTLVNGCGCAMLPFGCFIIAVVVLIVMRRQ